jgi:hypothetical protein
MNGGVGTWSIRPASARASSACSSVSSNGAPTDCSGSPPAIPPAVGCVRATTDHANVACAASAPTSLRSLADTTTRTVVAGPRYTAAFGIDHAFPLSSTLFIADVVMERYVDLYDIANVIGELGLRHQLSPQVVADVGVSRTFAGRVRSSAITLGLSFDLPVQLGGSGQ